MYNKIVPHLTVYFMQVNETRDGIAGSGWMAHQTDPKRWYFITSIHDTPMTIVPRNITFYRPGFSTTPVILHPNIVVINKSDDQAVFSGSTFGLTSEELRFVKTPRTEVRGFFKVLSEIPYRKPQIAIHPRLDKAGLSGTGVNGILYADDKPPTDKEAIGLFGVPETFYPTADKFINPAASIMMGTVLDASPDNFQTDIFGGWGVKAETWKSASGGLMAKVINQNDPLAIGNLYAGVHHSLSPNSPLQNFTLIKPLKLTALIDIINK